MPIHLPSEPIDEILAMLDPDRAQTADGMQTSNANAADHAASEEADGLPAAIDEAHEAAGAPLAPEDWATGGAPEAADAPAKRLNPRNLAANRRNALKGGVKTPEGKAVSRHNARRHAIFASAFTPADTEDLRDIHERFRDDLEPATMIEEALVEKIALCYLRLERCARAEAQYYESTWDASAPEFFRLDGVRPFCPDSFELIATVLSRYDTSLTNQLLRLVHELERLQRARKGEAVPPPAAADLTLSEG